MSATISLTVNLGCGAVADQEDRVPALQEGRVRGPDRKTPLPPSIVRVESAADDEDHARAVRLGRLQDIERQGHPELVAVDDIANAACSLRRMLGWIQPTR